MVTETYKPHLCWLNTKDAQPGYVEADLDKALCIPGQEGYIGRTVRTVRGNCMRGRPRFLDLLNIWFLDEFTTEDLPVNECLHGSYNAVCPNGLGEKFWKGPVYVHLSAINISDTRRMKDITLTAYRDAVDFLAYFRDGVGSLIEWPEYESDSSQLVMKDLTGKVKGVRINCLGDQAGDLAREFVQVDVPRTHPVFLEGYDPLEIALNFDERWVVDRYNGYKDTSAEEAQNTSGRNLQLSISERMLESKGWGKVPENRVGYTTGSLLVVDRFRKDIDVSKVRAACQLVKEQVIPLLAKGDKVVRAEILNALTPGKLEQFM
jgi:hypothetical protein